jgi:hypothetical protein
MAAMKRSTAFVLTAVAGVVCGILVFIGVAALTGSGTAKSRLGTDHFVIGQARVLTKTIDRHGPLLFQDLVGRSRDIFVHHVDGEWRAFAAQAPGALRRCQLRWRPATRDFDDRCSNAIYPANGDGLTQYPITVDGKGKVVVDVRSPTTPAPSTTVPT